MKEVKCPLCRGKVQRYGKTKVGTQRWLCRSCNYSFVQRIDNTAKTCRSFVNWLFSKQRHKDMPGGGRTFRRKTSSFWAIWPMPTMQQKERLEKSLNEWGDAVVWSELHQSGPFPISWD